MSKILFSGVGIVDMRGKVNGTVFSKNRYGAYARTKVTPVNPQTTLQQNARAILAANSSAWRDLTDSQRAAWIDAAPDFPITDIFGNSKVLSGSSLFVKLNNNLMNAFESPISDAPLPVAVPTLTFLSIAAAMTGGTFAVTFTPTPLPTGFVLVTQVTKQITPGKSFVKNEYRTFDASPAASTSPFAIGTQYINRFGALVPGMKIFARSFFVSLDSGQAGIAMQAECVVGA